MNAGKQETFDIDHIFRNELAHLDITMEVFQKYCELDETPIGAKLITNSKY